MRKIILLMLCCLVSVTFAYKPLSPLIPMGAVTGKPTEAQIKETLESYKAVGIDQFLIYPRSGLELEYLGDEWFQVCEWICKHAERLGMGIWLYDEYNWPSGSCKNRVQAANPDFCYRIYAVYKNKDGVFEWKRVPTPDRVDNYSFEAMKLFIEMTHKQYEKHLRNYMGSTIKGIFTDEPAHPGHVEVPGKPVLQFRYYNGLDEEYKAKTGRSFRKDVEAYLVDKSKNAVWPVYAELLGRRFRTAYFDPIRAWCDSMGILSTGHMIAESSTSISFKCNGAPMHVLKGLSLPGMDEIGTRTTSQSIEWITFGVAQHAAGRNGNGGLVELFALGPADMKLARQRQMIWLSAMHKLDHYVLAVAPLDARGNVEKHAYFNPFSRMQPWFPALRLLSDEARLAALYASKPFICDVGIRYPRSESAIHGICKKKHPLLNKTLRCFESEGQTACDLYEENEPCDKPFVFAFTGGSLKEEKSGRVFKRPADAVAFMHEQRPPAVRILDKKGKRIKDILLRCYKDGNIVVLNLTSDMRKSLLLKQKGGEDVVFDLPERGVFVLDENGNVRGEAVSNGKLCAKVPPETVYDIDLSTDNLCRLVFNSDKKAVFTVESSLDNVSIAVRNYPDANKVLLDGKVVETKHSCDSLVQGFKTLYLQSEPIKLAAGEHIMTISGGGSDTNFFLPVAFLSGSFAVEKQRVLKPLSSRVSAGTLTGQGLPCFTGKAVYSALVDVPEGRGDLRLKLNTGGLYTSASLDGVDMGERAWFPYEWKVPANLKGKKVKLEVGIRTSVLPMFGDWKHSDAAWSTRFWVPPVSGRTEVGLPSPPEWVMY
ncbi:MAG: hypothetical protein R6V06_02280 [Kiritimatiellia bacterium]